MKMHYSLRIQTVIHIDGEGETEQQCLMNAKDKATELINAGSFVMDVYPLKKTQVEE